MKKAFSVLAFTALAAYGGFKGFVWYQTSQALDELKVILAPHGALEYGWIGSSLTGEISVDDVRLTPFLLKDTLNIDRVVVKTSGAGELLSLLGDLQAGQVPDSLEWRVEGLRMGLSSPALERWVADPVSQAFSKVACGKEQTLGPAAWRAMGYQQLVSDLKFKYRLDPAAQTLTLNLRGETQEMSSGELMLTLKLKQPGIPFGGELAAQPPQLEYARLSYEDNAYMSRVARYCRGISGLEQTAYVEQSVKEWEQALAELGLRINSDFRQAYRLWLSGGKRLLIELDPPQEVDYGLLPFIKPADALEMLGAHLRVGEYAVHDMAIQWDTGALLAAMKGEQPVAEPEQPVARAPAPAPVRQPAYRTVAFEELADHLEFPVRIHTVQGKVYEGKLLTVEKVGVQVGALVSGGVITYPVHRDDIIEMEVYR